MVYYRKYRPQTISELDLPHVREKLSAILSSKELPHAFLFTGSKGLGKTSSARILAKAINCTDKKGIEPCNKCEACISITNGSNIDVLEIDAASNGGVEEIRTLREKVKFSSSTLKYKVYIIDEVHMLSTGAFNALLKTLEEPPSHVIFILATTELWKLPATVVSRAFQVLFEKPTNEEIVQSLERIVKGEKLQVEGKVIEAVASLSDGAFRDGAKLLEELVLSAKGEKITQDLFDATFKTKGLSSEVLGLLNAYGKRDAKKALEIIARLHANGVDFKTVTERIVDHLRGLLMLRNGIESSEKDVEELSLVDVKSLLELANEAYGELRLSIIPQLPLELLSVKFCVIDADQNVVGVPVVEKKTVVENPQIVTQKQSEPPKVASNLLHQLMEKVNQTNKPAAALLRSCKEATLTDGTLFIMTPFPIHAERLMSEKVFSDIKKAAENVVGSSVDVSVKILPN